MQIELFEVLKQLNRLEPSIEKSLLVKSTPASPPHLEPTPQTEEPAPSQTDAIAELIVVSTLCRNQKHRR